MRVISWNVNSIRSRTERLLGVLERHQPDFVCLQELKCLEEQFPHSEIKALGYQASIYGQKTWNGVAILSRSEPEKVQRGFPNGWDADVARLIRVQYGQLHIFCAYVPNGQSVGSDKFAYKRNWMKNLISYLEEQFTPEDQVILTGDFNVAPEDRDCHDPSAWKGKVLFSDEEKDAFETVLGLGYTDTFRLHQSEGGLFSWWDYRMLGFPKNRGMRIDFILCSGNLVGSCTHSFIDREERKGDKPSDHAPVITDFNKH